jgi:hypothetical protein
MYRIEWKQGLCYCFLGATVGVFRRFYGTWEYLSGDLPRIVVDWIVGAEVSNFDTAGTAYAADLAELPHVNGFLTDDSCHLHGHMMQAIDYVGVNAPMSVYYAVLTVAVDDCKDC